MIVLAAHPWPSNAHLIEDVARLGYLHEDDLVLDPTYGRGAWWKRWRPTILVTQNRDEDGSDFTDMHWEDDIFDAVAFDPPYVAMGGRSTTGLPEFFARFGLTHAPRTPTECQAVINAGLEECHRVVCDKGIVLVKCQDYVNGGRLWLGSHWTLRHALEVGFVVVDRLERLGRPRPQPPSNANQVHARRNHSTLFVLGKGKVWLRKDRPA